MIRDNKKLNGNYYRKNIAFESRNKYFCIDKVEIIWEGQTPIGYSFGEARDVYNKEIFDYAFREKVCSKCKKEKLSSEFYWKVKGFEGPFMSLWGRRQPECIGCEKSNKKVQYKKKVKKITRVTNVISDFKISEVFMVGKEVSQELNRLILDFSFEVINGADK